MRRFQSTHPHGVRLYHTEQVHNQNHCFNPRTRMGCDLDKVNGGFLQGVSIHAPAWGATCFTENGSREPKSFNPRTRMGCDAENGDYCDGGFLFQSTHPHGVRQQPPLTTAILHKFQSTHPHGVRLAFPPQRCSPNSFQSTHPHGVRRPLRRLRCSCSAVSIHAPAWGATSAQYSLNKIYLFQSTHPHGVRPATALILFE